MSQDHAREYIICYDIGEPKRLSRIHRMLKRIALPLQYSVFYTRMSERQRNKLAELLEKRIDPLEDDLRIYPLPPQYNVQYLGCEPFMEGLIPGGQTGTWEPAIDKLLSREAQRQDQEDGE